MSKAIVVSAGWRCFNYLNAHIESVSLQTYGKIRHGIVLDECSYRDCDEFTAKHLIEFPRNGFILPWTEKGCTLNSQHEVLFLTKLDPEDVIFWLDVDDRFHDPDVVSYIMSLYESNPELLLTYGQLVPDPYDSRCPRAMPYPVACHNNRDYRRASKWGHQFNHLRTMKVKLWESIPESYTLAQDNKYMTVAGDAAEMIAGMELAGPDRFKFVDRPNVLYTTDNQLSDWRRDPKLINRTHAWIEGMPKLPLWEGSNE
jgi:hypothetical protein